MTRHQEKVRAFMRLAKQETPDSPTIPNKEVRYLRAKLILEECIEAVNALGFDIIVNSQDDNHLDEKTFNDVITLLHKDEEIDINNLAKELADISVVAAAGTATAFGIDIEPILDIVDNNNLDKFGPGSYKNEYGKHCKPPNHPKPHEAIGAIIELQKKCHELKSLGLDDVKISV